MSGKTLDHPLKDFIASELHRVKLRTPLKSSSDLYSLYVPHRETATRKRGWFRQLCISVDMYTATNELLSLTGRTRTV